MYGNFLTLVLTFSFKIGCAKFPFSSHSPDLMIVLLHSSLLVEVFFPELIFNLVSLVSFLSKAG